MQFSYLYVVDQTGHWRSLHWRRAKGKKTVISKNTLYRKHILDNHWNFTSECITVVSAHVDFEMLLKMKMMYSQRIF